MANKYKLLLKRFAATNVDYQFTGAYRLRVEASDPLSTGVDPNVFLYLRRPPNPTTGLYQDDVIGTASPADLAEYPIGQPSGSTTYPIFRLSWFEVDVRSPILGAQLWEDTKARITNLLEGLDALEDHLTFVEETWVGDLTDDGGLSDSDSV